MSTVERIQEKRLVKRRIKFKKIAMYALTAVSFVALFFLLRQPWFAFGTVYITGTERLSRQEILALTGLKEPVNLIILDKANVEHILTNDLRIKKAAVSYELPNILRIDILEEAPFFYIKTSYGFAGVRSDGKLMSAGKNIKDALAPVLTGVSIGNTFVGDTVSTKEINYFRDFLTTAGTEARGKIAEIHINSSGKAKIFDLSGVPYIIGDLTEAGKKSMTFSAIVKEINEKNLAVEFADLSYSKPYIKIKKQS